MVDFPRLYDVRLFGEEEFHRRGAETQSQAKFGTEVGTLREKLCEKLWVVTRCFANVHEVSLKFALIRPVNPRCYAFSRVRPFFRGAGECGEMAVEIACREFLAADNIRIRRGQFSSVVEQRFCKPSVVGSIPTTGSICHAPKIND